MLSLYAKELAKVAGPVVGPTLSMHKKTTAAIASRGIFVHVRLWPTNLIGRLVYLGAIEDGILRTCTRWQQAKKQSQIKYKLKTSQNIEALMKWIDKPYPLLENSKYKWLFALLSGIFVFLFLIVFEPFGATELTAYEYLFLAGFGVAVFLGTATTYFILPKLLRAFFHPEKWTVGKEILLLSSCILIISAFNYLHNNYMGRGIVSYQTYFSFLKITMKIGIFPILGLVFFTERTLFKRNIKRAQLLANQLPPATVGETITLQIQEESVKASPIVMQLSQFVYAQSEGNYVAIYYLDEGTLSRKLIRLSLKQLEIQLEELSQIKRCHRSFLINIQHITSIDGNARSLTIQLEKVAKSIPVSRSFSKADFY